MAGAPVGNINKKAGREWREALYRALEIKTDQLELNHRNAVMDRIAMQLVDAALAGEQWALKEFADRIEGKAAQSVELSGNSDSPVSLVWPLPKTPLDK